ncbi:competence type IV pilus minor pilin ComGD [Bacillus sp. SG-1]|uniref:competence type IV pilus minor pilin ComGD n=1 Tax=Bacillus sp. SG-1 TaxID=161544 RepID=UPI0005C46653|nr:competence type IV pilus minor pilin ComGD [Bacillus sp. SG-1]
MLWSKIKGKQNGYTMVEMLVVLSISLTLLIFTSILILPIHDTLTRKNFISLLKSDLYYLQSYAINKKEEVSLQFYPYGGKYSGRVVGGESLFVRNLPEGISQIPNSSLSSLTFYPNGNTDRFGSLYYIAGEEQIKVTFQIGQGRFNVQE